MTPRPGDFGVVRTDGWAGRLIRWATRSPVNHAVLCVGDVLVEGDPRGARIRPLSQYGDRVAWADWPLSVAQRATIVRWGVTRVGTPYSWLDCLYIGLVDRFGWAPQWARRQLASTRTLMCSQLVCAAYDAAGVHLFSDGRPFGGVSPGDLYDLIPREQKVKQTSLHDWWF